MVINPGGRLAIEDIIGRDALVADIREALEVQSVVLTAERRIGKTHVVIKLAHQPLAGQTLVSLDVGDVGSADEFTRKVIESVEPLLRNTDRFKIWMTDIAAKVGGAQVGPLKLPVFAGKNWENALRQLFQQIAECGTGQFVLMWDELPWMLQKIAAGNPREAMDLLDILRSVRQTHDKVRMVYTGSLGLHHIIRQLRDNGYNNDPTNDMMVIEVPPLAADDAIVLVKKLFDTAQLNAASEAVFTVIAEATNGVGYWIHWLVRDIRRRAATRPGPITLADVDAVIQDAIEANGDPWHLKHYLDRSKDYYGDQRTAALALLDAVAGADTPIPVGDAINRAKLQAPDLDETAWLELLSLLQRDHYVLRERGTGLLRFKFSPVLKWWRWHRNLGAAR